MNDGGSKQSEPAEKEKRDVYEDIKMCRLIQLIAHVRWMLLARNR